MIASIFTNSNGYLTSTILQCYHYSNLFSYTLYLLEKLRDKCSVLNNTNYNKFIHINIHFVHKRQIQLLTPSVNKTFLLFAAHAVFHTLSSSEGRIIHKTLFTNVKAERKVSVLSIPSN